MEVREEVQKWRIECGKGKVFDWISERQRKSDTTGVKKTVVEL